MKSCFIIVSLAFSWLLAGTVGGDDFKTQRVRCTGSGTFVDGVDTHIDANNDGTPASLNQGLENCNSGRFFFQFEDEYVGPFAPTTCPPGTLEFNLVQAHTVLTDQKTSDQLFSEDAAGGVTFCQHPDGTFSFTEHGTFNGGTGQFTGARGTFDSQGTGKYLISGFKDTIFAGFAQFTFTQSWTLILPNH